VQHDRGSGPRRRFRAANHISATSREQLRGDEPELPALDGDLGGLRRGLRPLAEPASPPTDPLCDNRLPGYPGFHRVSKAKNGVWVFAASLAYFNALLEKTMMYQETTMKLVILVSFQDDTKSDMLHACHDNAYLIH